MKLFKLIVLSILVTLSSYAGVNLKNGNYYISYIDIIVPGGGHDLEVSRTYNSKSFDKGWFGYGWGSDFETYLSVSADGSVVVHEYGSGAMTRFTPKQEVNVEAALNNIIEAMRKRKGALISEKVANDLKKKLKNDAELRQAYARRFNVKAKLASGTILYSNQRGLQQIHKTKKGFMRVYNDGKKQFFSDAGKLSKVSDKHGYNVKLTYKNGRVYSVKDSQAKQLFFEWYPNGLAKSIRSNAKKKTSYKYDDEFNLIESVDVASNKFKYKYDDNHNMAEVIYGDGSKSKITYTKKTQLVSSITDRNKKTTTYKYGANSKAPELHYWTTVGKANSAGKKVNNRYEYELKIRPDGSQYTYRILTVVNNFKTETVYSECCSLPLKITRGKHVTTFDYNSKGLLTKKSSSKGDYVQLDYHKKFNKITRVVNNKGWTNFEYDKKGNLAKAVNNKGKSVLLIYDRKGRISKMVDYNKKNKKKRTLAFKYNAQGKPVEIAMEKIGKIHVAYDNFGEIKKVESKAGHKMALQVTQAFQSLLTIVKPAGVNLNL